MRLFYSSFQIKTDTVKIILLIIFDEILPLVIKLYFYALVDY